MPRMMTPHIKRRLPACIPAYLRASVPSAKCGVAEPAALRLRGLRAVTCREMKTVKPRAREVNFGASTVRSYLPHAWRYR